MLNSRNTARHALFVTVSLSDLDQATPHMKHLVVALLCLLSTSTASSQWTLINKTDTKADTCFFCGFHAVKFFSADTGVAFGAKDRNYGSVKWLTYDGGRSWSETILSSPGSSWVDAITDINHYWWSPGAKTYPGLRTSDGGLSYEELPPYSFYNFVSLYFVDSLLGFTGAERMEMHRTTDGGMSWVQVSDSATYSGYKMLWIAFNNPAIGIATTDEIATWVLRTVDSGKTWSASSDPRYPSYSRSRGISWPTPNAAYIFSHDALVLSADTGLTWHRVGARLPGMSARDGAFFDSLNGIVVGYRIPYDSSEATVVALTSDGGASWRRMVLDSMGTNDPKVHYPAKNVAYVQGRTKLYRLDIDKLAIDNTTLMRAECFKSEFFDHSVNLTFDSPLTGQVYVTDVLGRTLKRVVIQAQSSLSIEIDDLPGLILVNVPCNEGYRTLKIQR
jgi:photosystem II stability/assembly factor-like uncharacterized protein